jgi:integrase
MPWVEKLSSGRWQARYKTPDGKKHSAGTFDHKTMALRKAARAEDDAFKFQNRDANAGKRTWGEWCDHWWSTRSVSPGTLSRDASPVRKYLRPRWDDVPLNDITRHDVRAWVNELNRTLAPSSVSRYLAIFTSSLTAAVDAEVLMMHPALNIKFDHGEVDVQRYFTHGEANALIDALPETERGFVHTLFYSGMRWGELVGLEIRRVDLRRRNMRVAEVWDNRTSSVRQYPKGRRIRDVPIFDDTIPYLEEAIGLRKSGFVFQERRNIDNWRKRVWDRALNTAELGSARIHDTRHTYASWLLQNGVTLAEVGRLLGHASSATTQRYAHLAESPRDHIFAALRG